MSTEAGDKSDWVSQAEAGRMLGVTRQAVSKMIRAGRLQILEIGGHVLVKRSDLVGLPRRRGETARPQNDAAQGFIEAFGRLRPEVQVEVLRRLRETHPLHPFEARVGASAEVILEALDRSGPLTIRGLRGVLAESAFEVNVLGKLGGWRNLPTPNDPPYDFLLDDGLGAVKVQVKLQRSKGDRPMLASEGNRRFSSEMYTVETQRTRGGKKRDGEDSRPYRYGEFDILVVAMQASSRDWNHFLCTVGDWLIPRVHDPRLLSIYQPVPRAPDEHWTDDFVTCVEWLRSGRKGMIGGVL